MLLFKMGKDMKTYSNFFPVIIAWLLFNSGLLTIAVKDGYYLHSALSDSPDQFNSKKACSEKDKTYRTDPGLKHKIHCVVSVIPADTPLWCADKSKASDNAGGVMEEAFIRKFKIFRQHANSLGKFHKHTHTNSPK